MLSNKMLVNADRLLCLNDIFKWNDLRVMKGNCKLIE
jgi:hypothetical protein